MRWVTFCASLQLVRMWCAYVLSGLISLTARRTNGVGVPPARKGKGVWFPQLEGQRGVVSPRYIEGQRWLWVLLARKERVWGGPQARRDVVWGFSPLENYL